MRARYRFGVAAAAAVLSTAAWLAANAAEPAQKKGREPQTETEDAAAAALPESIKAERAIAKKPADRGARLRAARAQLAEGADVPSRVEAANQHALAALNDAPNDVEALMLAGQTSLLKNDARGAVRYYRAATLVDAQNATAFLGLGDALTRIGDEAGANDAFGRYRALMGMAPIERNNNN